MLGLFLTKLKLALPTLVSSQNLVHFILINMQYFFLSDVNVTVWTVGYAMPYHATKSYESCKVGYGIISLQKKRKKRLNTQGLKMTRI